jgi:hypothetical protein
MRFGLAVAAQTYRRHWQLPKDALTASELQELRPAIEQYLRAAASAASTHWVDQESRVHAGLMRRYGLLASASSAFVIFDREVVLGHADAEGRGLVTDQLRTMGLSAKGRISRELDAIAVLPGPEIGLIEIKSDERHVEAAASQVAIYLERFERLRRTQESLEGLRDLVTQKVRIGLVPGVAPAAQLTDDTPFRPIVAMPGKVEGWPDTWRRRLAGGQKSLPGLELWRVSKDGEVEERARAWR